MRITHTTKEVVSSIDISLFDIAEANALFTELAFLDRRHPFAQFINGSMNRSALPHLDNLFRQLKSKIEAIRIIETLGVKV